MKGTSFISKVKYRFMKDLGAPAISGLRGQGKEHQRKREGNHLGPPLRCGRRLREIMTRHFYLARYARGAKPVAWVTSGAPVEILRPFGFYTLYPENHGALCGARKMGPALCSIAEEHGYSADLCSYARIDLGHMYSGKTPAGKLPKPDLLFASDNICQTVVYWYKTLAQQWRIPLIVFDTPFNYGSLSEIGISYMRNQFQEMIPILERISGRDFEFQRLKEAVRIARETALAWGRVLATMRARPSPMTIFDAFTHMAPVVSLRGLPVALSYYRDLLAELEQRVDQGIGGVRNEKWRLMWDNIAIWYKMREYAHFFAERGANFVAATYTHAWAETTPFLDHDHPFESMAKAYSLVILNNNLQSRLGLMERLIQEYEADGLILHSARSCKPYSVGQYDLKRLLSERMRVPAVIIEADIADSRAYSEQQVRTRLEAFLESLPS